MIHGKTADPLVAELAVRAHRFVSGLDPALGGGDEGPNPHELVEAALAACTTLTARLYADRKGIPLEAIEATVRIVAEGARSTIRREVSFAGPLTPEQSARLAEIVGKCPIHRLLESEVRIETEVVPSASPPAG